MADLTSLQREVLRQFFAVEQGFFLSGGAALAGFYLHHRTTVPKDLKLPPPLTHDLLTAYLADLVTRFRKAALPAARF